MRTFSLNPSAEMNDIILFRFLYKIDRIAKESKYKVVQIWPGLICV